MDFKFNVKLTDQDYFDFNKFWLIRSPYGKKQTRSMRIIITVILGIFIIGCLIRDRFTLPGVIAATPFALLLVLLHVLLNPWLTWSVKGQLKKMKKVGKMAYAPDSLLEFGEDSMVETTPEEKTERSYGAIERISVVDNRVIYIHTNNVGAYILPLSCFVSQEQCDGFFEFIKTKCPNIVVY